MLYIATQILAVIGLAISCYFIHIYKGYIKQNTKLLPKENCPAGTCGNIVATDYSYLFWIPNFVLVIFCYIELIVLGFVKSTQLLIFILIAVWGSVGFAVYLIHAMLYRIHIVCRLCMVTHAINLLIAIIYTIIALA